MPGHPTPPPTHHILLCVAGLTPQIITETLYALTQQRGEWVDEIRVITTLSGRSRVLQDLLEPQHGQFFRFCRDYQLDPARIAFDDTTITLLHSKDGRMLHDIRSVHDNTAAADQISEVVRELTRDPHTRLHASAAGGRKTMSIYLTAAMQLYGRAQDRLSHVLVSEAFETLADFFYIPPVPQELAVTDRLTGQVIGRLSTATAEIHLADIPFIRLRGVQSAWLHSGAHSYGEAVDQAQENLDVLDAVHELRLNPRHKTIMVANRRIILTERELFIYALFADLRQEGRGNEGFVQLDEIADADLDRVFRRLTAARGQMFHLVNASLVPRYEFLTNLVHKRTSTKAEDYEDVLKTFVETISKIKRKCEAKHLPERYFITTRRAPGASRYGLLMAPERLIWEA